VLGVATLGFLIAFAAVRGLTYSIHMGIGPFHDVATGGTHIHHMVWGIVLLLAVGYARLFQEGLGTRHAQGKLAHLMAAAYGVGAALTLDEFALWLNMRDVYWQVLGWQSIGAILVFGCLLLAGIWGRPGFQTIVEAVVRHRANVSWPSRAERQAWVAGDRL
jgi:hypothetical protein